jgi:ribosome maturation factor RimP
MTTGEQPGRSTERIRVRDDARLEQMRAAAERVAQSCGLDLFDVQYRREAIGWVLRVVIDRPVAKDEDGRVLVDPPDRSIGVEECQRVSHDLSAILDVEDPVDRAYTLEVSSPGLERPLRDHTDYARFVGRLAKIVVREAVNGQMHFEGRLRAVDDDAVELESGKNKMIRLPFDNIVRGRLAVEF